MTAMESDSFSTNPSTKSLGGFTLLLALAFAGISGCSLINGSVSTEYYSSSSEDLPSSCDSTLANSYGGGTGTSTDPYLICSLSQWQKLATSSNDWSKSFKLAADIDMSSMTTSSFQMVGSASAPFSGTLDGDNHQIRNLSLSDAASQFALFHTLGGASISNLTLSNFSIASNLTCAGLAIQQTSGNLTLSNISINSSSFSSPSTGASGHAGLLGSATSLTCSRCNLTQVDFASAGTAPNAGLVKTCTTCSISNSTVSGLTYSGSNGSMYGMVGTSNGGTLTISNSTLSAVFNNVMNFGGLVGAVQNGSGSISNTTASVSSSGTAVNSSGAVSQIDSSASVSLSKVGVTLNISNVLFSFGGLAYQVYGPLSISDSYVKGSISGGNFPNMAFAAAIGFSGTLSITDSYSQTSISNAAGSNGVSGLIAASTGPTVTLTRVYQAGAVSGNTGNTSRGCIATNAVATTATDSYYDSNLCTLGKAQQSGAMAGVTAQTTANLTNGTTWTNYNNGKWVFSSGSYPRLYWE